jgi:ubiquitin-protein ligase
MELRNRIKREYEDLQKNKSENCIEVWLVNDDISHWKGKISGPVINLIKN